MSIVNFYIVYELYTCLCDLNTDFTLGDFLFGAVMVIKIGDNDKYEYIGYGTGFETRSTFSLSNDSGGYGKMLLLWCR